jgi:hypothetical protein
MLTRRERAKMDIKMLHAESAKRHVFKDSILEDFIEKQKSLYMSLQLCEKQSVNHTYSFSIKPIKVMCLVSPPPVGLGVTITRHEDHFFQQH